MHRFFFKSSYVKVFALWGSGLAAVVLAVVIILSSQYADPPQVEWQERQMVDSSEAYMGRWRMNDSDFRYVDDPSVSITEAGETGLVWADQQEQEIYFRRFDENCNTASERVNVSQSPDIFSWLPRIAHHPENSDKIFVVWQDIVFSGGSHGGEIFFAKSDDGGASFSTPVNLSNTQDGAGKGRHSQQVWDNGSLDLAVDSDGQVYIVWTEFEGRLRFIHSDDGGDQFKDPLTLADDANAGPARAPSIAVSDEKVHVVWSTGENPAADIYHAYSDDRGGEFRAPETVDQSGGHSDAPQAALDSNGNLHVVYGESSDGPMRDYHIRYTRLESGEEGFSNPKEIARPQENGFAGFHYPTIRIGGADNLYVMWVVFPENVRESRGLAVSTSGDGGRRFSDAEVIPGTNEAGVGINGSRQGSLMTRLDVNQNGDLVVVNSTFQAGESSYIWKWQGSSR